MLLKQQPNGFLVILPPNYIAFISDCCFDLWFQDMNPKFARGSNRQTEGFWLEIENADVKMSGGKTKRRVVAKQRRADMCQLIEEKELTTVITLGAKQKKQVVVDTLYTLPSALKSAHTSLHPSALSNTNRRRPSISRGIVRLGPGCCFGAR